MRESSTPPFRYDPPSPKKELKNKHHPRSINEFRKSGSAPISYVGSNQREPIPFEVSVSFFTDNKELASAQVPPEDGSTLHLGVSVVDIKHQSHAIKICVPDGTKVIGESLMKNNDLKCLNLDGCGQGVIFDRQAKAMYLEVSEAERRQLLKKCVPFRWSMTNAVRHFDRLIVFSRVPTMHMINLYQTDAVNRAFVAEHCLKKCMLAFWFANLKNGNFQRVSEITYSTTIEESMMIAVIFWIRNKVLSCICRRCARTSLKQQPEKEKTKPFGLGVLLMIQQIRVHCFAFLILH